MEFQLSGIVDETLRKWPIPEGTTQVGRSSELPISLPDRSVSRVHAQVQRQDDSIFVQDLNSRNGTTVNGVRVREAQPLQPGDQVSFGNVTLTLINEAAPMQLTMTPHVRLDSTMKLAWNDVRSLPPKEEDQSQLITVITELGEFLVGHQPMEKIYDICLETVGKLVPYQRACLLLQDGDGDPVLKAARVRAGRADLDLALSRTMVDTVVHERASLLVHDAMSDPVFGAAQSVILEQIRSALIVPLFDNAQVIGVLYVDTRELSAPYTKEHLRRLALLANILAVKISNARLLEVQLEAERLEQEMQTAARIQRALLTKELPCPAGYELCAKLEPCTEVGGDLYDVLELPDGRFALVLGDVVGHGVGAALLMANALAVIRALAGDILDPVEMVRRIDAQIYNTTDSTSYLTMFLGILDPQAHTMQYVNAGHEAPAVLAPGADPVRLESTSPPVGLLPGARFESATASIPPGALFAAWSDGIPEAHNLSDDDPVFFGEAQPLLELLGQDPKRPVKACADDIFARVDAFLAGAHAPDDRTLLLLRRL